MRKTAVELLCNVNVYAQFLCFKTWGQFHCEEI